MNILLFKNTGSGMELAAMAQHILWIVLWGKCEYKNFQLATILHFRLKNPKKFWLANNFSLTFFLFYYCLNKKNYAANMTIQYVPISIFIKNHLFSVALRTELPKLWTLIKYSLSLLFQNITVKRVLMSFIMTKITWCCTL